MGTLISTEEGVNLFPLNPLVLGAIGPRFVLDCFFFLLPRACKKSLGLRVAG